MFSTKTFNIPSYVVKIPHNFLCKNSLPKVTKLNHLFRLYQLKSVITRKHLFEKHFLVNSICNTCNL